MSTATAERVYEFTLPLSTPAELELFLWACFGVRIPNVRVCPNHRSPWEALCAAFFAESPVVVWKASRGFGGKSHLLSALGLCEAIGLGVDVNILGGSGEQSERVHETMGKFWFHEDAPRELLTGDPTAQRTKLSTGATITALTASQKSVRGPHPTRLRLDEVDEMDQAILDAALGQTMDKGSIRANVVCSSTHQHSDGTMSAILREADKRGWPVFEWCFQECMAGENAWLDRDQVERKRATVPRAMWEAEYELQEPNPASRAIDSGAVAQCFDRGLGEYYPDEGQELTIEEPERGGRYGTGADWGRKRHYTVIDTGRKDTSGLIHRVAWRHSTRRPWPILTGYLNGRLDRYPGAAAHDATGIGDVVDVFIQDGVEPFLFVGRERENLLTEYINAIERGEIVGPFIDVAEREHRLASVEDVFYREGHLPDSIAAGALMYRAIKMGSGIRLSDVRGMAERPKHEPADDWEDASEYAGAWELDR
ncbi:MAG: hypothetical protein KC729_00035 [Candidatus Eisenbacteria bacterium]|uniref:Terminase large subunit gp17-like C-terminal domain-containing protein n=1 Tax=Eiseniibacteriota bacterium TaxID=2212470 RepID=A0A956LVB6_UNCEI|nr:hypothetical protein [Candidatus Eisenbacteria bacterium]